jgi:hypothetical protein
MGGEQVQSCFCDLPRAMVDNMVRTCFQAVSGLRGGWSQVATKSIVEQNCSLQAVLRNTQLSSELVSYCYIKTEGFLCCYNSQCFGAFKS